MKVPPLRGSRLLPRCCIALAALLILPAVVQAQTASLSVGSAAGLPGTNVDISVSFAPGATAVSSLQFDLTFPSSLAYVSTTTGSAAAAAGKSASGNAISGGVRVLVFGLNQTAIGSGSVAVIRLTIAGGTPAGSIAIGITNITGTTPDANPVAVSGSGGSVTVNAPADTTPPIISGVAAGSISATSAVITWTTNEAADSQVEYGTTTAYGASTSLNSTRVTSHSQSLSGLAASTLYHYRVRSRDAAGNLAVSGDFTFTTTATPDTTPPIISGVSAGSISATSAVITWTTNEAADSQVEYGTTTAYGASTTLNSTRVTSHSQSLSGLAAGTLYHFRVRSRDAAGNLAVSGDYTFTTTTSSDTTPPTISGVSAGGITATSAVITWNTNEAADSQVEYGTTTAYGTSTTLDSARVTSHSQTLSGLTINTTYHYRVRSRDAAGNLAVSGDFTFTTGDSGTGSPEITDVWTEPADQSAVITWTTHKVSTSQVEWGQTASYGQETAKLEDLVTSHWVRVTGLTGEKDYHFRVKSVDASGNLAVSKDYQFRTSSTVPRQPATLHLPILSLPQSPGQDQYTGIALANLDTGSTNVLFTAYDPVGNPVAGPDISNPVQRALKSGEQLPVLDFQIFGSGTSQTGWRKIESTSDKVAGFFLTFDGELKVLDGATASTQPISSFVFPEVGGDGFTRIYLANPNRESVSVTLRLTKSDGRVSGYVTRQIGPASVLAADLYAELFPAAQADPSDYLQVTATGGVVPYEMLGEAGKHMRVLSGQDTGKSAVRVYCAQYAVGGPWRSTISVINHDPAPGTVTMRFVPQGTSQPAATWRFDIAANGKIYLSDQTVFLGSGVNLSDTVVSGHVEIFSNGLRLSGSVAFGDSQGESFAAALPLVNELRSSVVFSHVASNDLYFTGLALLNPGVNAAMARIELYGADGNRQSSILQVVPGQMRISRVLTEIFPDLIGKDRTSGYIRVITNNPLACFALFGTNNLSVLSAIPAQPAP